MSRVVRIKKHIVGKLIHSFHRSQLKTDIIVHLQCASCGTETEEVTSLYDYIILLSIIQYST